ncbi:MAG: C40 family peptidase [Sulfurovum sp.]|uniref:C40 family peptidase n=1 Tax=Sulfurovum sp. TaxID=1969726 RepID=UPI0028682EF8|nr:LysM peptidoglycan-binding domain-containing protein [Sulfurovum sp.]MCO4844785.1 C40 family peptidase [Sulfurovum sp.]
MKKLYTLLLTLSLATVTSKASTHTINHTVKKGETLSGIARKHHTSIIKVRQANGLKKSDVLKFGKVLKVPTSSYAAKKQIPAASTKHVIKRGDTLSAIARKHHTTIAKVRKANGLKKNETIKIGQVLKVPQNKKTVKLAKVQKKASNKKLVTSLSRLDTISLETGKAKKSAKFNFSDIFASKKDENADKCQKITSLAKTKLGRKYVWGASGNKNTYDCSSFTKYVYKNIGVTIPRTSINQSKFGKYVKRDELKKGDLIFFDTSKRRKGYVNHVGIYLGDNKFIHASSAKKKVIITSLHKNFYSNRYKGARRPS